MKVLIVIHYYPPHIGGMEAVALKQVQSLVERGHEVTVLTCRSDASLALLERQGKVTIKRLRALNFVENKFGVTFPIINPLHVFWLLKNLPKFDLVHLHDVFYMTAHIAGVAAIVRRRKFFVTQHVAMVDHPSKLVMGVQKMIYHTVGKLIFSRAAGIVTYNVNVQSFLQNLGIESRKIIRNYNGIDTKFFSPASIAKTSLRKTYGLPADKPIALFVGRLVPKKGFDIVFDAAHPDFTTLIVGNGEVPRRMQSSKNVVFFGPANAQQLQDLYRLSDVFVFPAMGEIFTLVMQEAMASGLPVVTTDDPGYREYDLDRSRISLVPRDAASVRVAILTICADLASHGQMSQYSRDFAVRQFSWETNYPTEYNLYKQAGAEL
jgi:D-inositol-3-phosphate glycosyltransferase